MSEQGSQGLNGVTLSDRAVRHLGIEVANSQIVLATQKARMEELVEASTHIDFDLWEEVKKDQKVPQSKEDSDALALAPAPPPSYLVPSYQADAVARLIAMLRQQ